MDGDVILVGDCAKPLLERFPDAKYWGSSEEFPNCTPIWANIPQRSISNYIRNWPKFQSRNGTRPGRSFSYSGEWMS